MNIKLLIFTFVLLLSVGCSNDTDMREKFGDSLPHFFTEDATGDTYIIKHRFGNNYSVRLWKLKTANVGKYESSIK